MIAKTKIKKIIFITLTNIGDCILTLPVLDILLEEFPQSQIDVMVGPRPSEIFEKNHRIHRLVVYDKHAKLKEKINLFFELKKQRFDMVIDLRNSLFGILLGAKYGTSAFTIIPKHIKHMRDRHLYRLREVTKGYQRLPEVTDTKSLCISKHDEEYINAILKENKITEKDTIVIISAGARSHIKRWEKEKFVDLISALAEEFKVKIILVGDKDDVGINKYIAQHAKFPVIDLSAKTTIPQLAWLLEKVKLLITNDSAVLHIASYVNIPIVAIFGPTDEAQYGPW